MPSNNFKIRDEGSTLKSPMPHFVKKRVFLSSNQNKHPFRRLLQHEGWTASGSIKAEYIEWEWDDGTTPLLGDRKS